MRFWVSADACVDTLEPEALHALVLQGAPSADDLLLVQVTSAEVFEQAHIDGAVLVTPQELVCGVPPATGQLPDKVLLERLFGRIGFAADRRIVVYDDEGGGWAGRFAWTLDVIGHRSWRYLNGGLIAWHHAGLPLAQGPVGPPTPTEVSLTIDHGPIAFIEDVLAAIKDPQQLIWDVRSAEEYYGLRPSPARVGHIPGAVNLEWLLLRDPERQCRLAANIESELDELGICDKAIITHCHTHHRSGLSYMLGRLLNLNIKAYPGSWSEWGSREDTPIELG